MTIYFGEENPSEETFKTMEKAAILCAEEEGLDPDAVELSVSFVDKDEIQSLNAEYRNVDSVTDVLSFPQFDDLEETKDWEVITLGDVVICEDKAKEQAEEFGHSYERELIYLFVHSIFHLLGYDHMVEEDKTVMRAKEEKIMGLLGISR